MAPVCTLIWNMDFRGGGGELALGLGSYLLLGSLSQGKMEAKSMRLV